MAKKKPSKKPKTKKEKDPVIPDVKSAVSEEKVKTAPESSCCASEAESSAPAQRPETVSELLQRVARIQGLLAPAVVQPVIIWNSIALAPTCRYVLVGIWFAERQIWDYRKAMLTQQQGRWVNVFGEPIIGTPRYWAPLPQDT